MQPRRKIRFINPRSPLSTVTMPGVIQRMTAFSRKAIFNPTGLGICAAVMPKNWDSEIIDENVTDAPHAAKADVDMVGITAMTTQANRGYAVADEYRKLGVPVIMGGIHPSALPEDALKHCDAVCKGDAEGTLPHLIADFERGGKAAMQRIYDWTKFPEAPIATPRKDLLNPGDYLIFHPIQTTRGCPHSCNFCTTPGVFGRKFRQRSINSIVEEIREAKELHGTRVFIFADDDFGGNHKWALEMCAALEPLKIHWASQCDILISRNDALLAAMRRSGCLGLILGLESRRQDSLNVAGKKFVKAETYEDRIRKIQSYGISLWGAFIFGLDTDRWEDLMATTRWAQQMNLSMSCYPILTPYPGTGVWHEYKKAGRLITEDWDLYNGACVVYEPKHMSRVELRHAQLAAFAEFYSPRSGLRRLGLWPLKKWSWMTTLGVWRGIRYYYTRQGRPVPKFSDFLDKSRSSPSWKATAQRTFEPDPVECCPQYAQLLGREADNFGRFSGRASGRSLRSAAAALA